MSNMPRLPLRAGSGALLIALLVAACGTTSAPLASVSPGASAPVASVAPSPSASPAVGEIEYKTGATDVLLRIEEGGGFVPMEFTATNAPGFTLYGDGVIVFQQTVTTFPEPDASGIVRTIPWRTAKLDESQIQDLLEFALGAGGLGAARDSYLADNIADAPNTIFTIRAGGIDKVVTINALSEMTQPGPDAAARGAFFKLAQRLKDFDRAGSIPSDVYQPERYRGVIIEREAQAGLAAMSWPWPDIKPGDFAKPPADGSGGPPFPHRVMSAEEIAALKLADIDGGFQGATLKGPDGKLYSFILRPLLRDETV
jgi:hypothetical protein